jgi:hypothetical protein
MLAFAGSMACLSALLVAPSPARADDWYVDASAGSGGDGSSASPFQELQAGLDAAFPGDTVHAAAGNYAAVETVRDGTESQRITIVGEPLGGAIVLADGRALRAQHEYHTFEGIVFDGGYGGSDCVSGNGGHHLELLSVEIRRSGRDCIDLGEVTDVLISESSIHHCIYNEAEINDAHGVTGDSVFDLTIRETEIYLVTGDAFQLSPPRDPWGNVLIESCDLWSGPLDVDANGLAAGTVIGENAIDTKVDDAETATLTVVDVNAWGWQDFMTNQAAFNVKETVLATIDRTTVFDCEIAFRLRGPATVTVSNTVVYDTDKAFRLEDGLADAFLLSSTMGDDIGTIFEDAGGDPVNLTVQNMLFLGDSVPAEASSDASNVAVSETAFIDVSSDDYHLVEGASPVDTGITLSQVLVDRDGWPRPEGPGYDIGAYEWHLGSSDTDADTDSDSDADADTDVDADADADADTGLDDTGSSASKGCGCSEPGSLSPLRSLLLLLSELV